MDRRKKRTSYHQYTLYIKMLEDDQIFRTGVINRDADVNYIFNKWNELAVQLNNCGYGPTLSTEAWKKRLNDWKNSTRAKYRRSLVERTKYQTNKPEFILTPLEEKALNLWGPLVQGKPYTKDPDEEMSMLPASEDSKNEYNHNDKLEQSNPSERNEINSTIENNEEIPTKRQRRESDEESYSEDLIKQTVNLLDIQNLTKQLRRLANVKEEKLKFEIAKFKFKNPGFNYEYESKFL